MIVLYTFDIPRNFEHQNSVLMLSISIYTVLRELGGEVDQILIFSNNPHEIKKELKITDEKIVFKKISRNFSEKVKKSTLLQRYDGEFKDRDEHFRKIGDSFGAAHARVYLLDKISRRYKNDILYLDFDTGIAKGQGEIAISKIRNANLILEPLTSFSIAEDIVKIYPRINRNSLPKYVNNYACRWNCGIFYVKYQDNNLKILKDIKELYYSLIRDIGFMQSADEWAIGLSLFKNNTKPDITFDDISFYVPWSHEFVHTSLGNPPPFVHYMDQKNLEFGNSQWDSMLESWSGFFNGMKDEPTFNLWNYCDRKSNEYIWGRFETL